MFRSCRSAATRRREAAMDEEQWVLKGPEVPLPALEGPVGATLLRRVLSHGSKVIQMDGASGERVSGKTMAARAVAVARSLSSWGVTPGDVVAVAVDNDARVPSIVLGAMAVGAIYAPFNPDLSPGDLSHMIRMLVPRVVVIARRALEALEKELIDEEASMYRVVAWGSREADAMLDPASDDEVTGFCAASTTPAAVPAPDPATAPALIMASSGTTGPPKGVVLSQYSIHYLIHVFSLFDSQSPEEVRAKDVVIQVMQNFWLTGLMTSLLNLYNGTTVVVFPKFDVETILGAVQEHRGTFLSLAPNQVAAIAKHPHVERFDVSSLRMLTCSGAVLSPAARALAEQRMRKKMVLFYGQTECMFAIMPGPKSALKPTSSGTAAINSCVKVIDPETGKTVGPNVEGEMCLKSGMRFLYYYGNADATREVLDEEGWVHTGDVAYYDEDGYLFIYDRYKELIKFRGTHVAPADIENVLLGFEGVRDAAVVGVESDEDQEHPVGFIVLQPGGATSAPTASARDILLKANEQLPVYKRLHGGLYVVEEIPRTSTGKIKRRELRQKARDLKNGNL